MKRRFSLAVILCLVAATVLLIAVSSAAAASSSMGAWSGQMMAMKGPVAPPVLSTASGEWSWWYLESGGYAWDSAWNTWAISYNTAERGNWTGTFKGSSVEPWSVYSDDAGGVWALITIYFTGKVEGHFGKAEIQLTVEIPPSTEGAEMDGHWAVVRGKGGLKGLFGIGTWSIFPGDDHADYTGAYWLP